MALARAIDSARHQNARRSNRDRQIRAEVRLDEIVKVAGIADEYDEVDRRGDLDIETHFGRLWQAAETELMRDLIARTFAAWMRDEAEEERIVRAGVDGAVDTLKVNNGFWIEGAAVPSGSEPAA